MLLNLKFSIFVPALEFITNFVFDKISVLLQPWSRRDSTHRLRSLIFPKNSSNWINNIPLNLITRSWITHVIIMRSKDVFITIILILQSNFSCHRLSLNRHITVSPGARRNHCCHKLIIRGGSKWILLRCASVHRTVVVPRTRVWVRGCNCTEWLTFYAHGVLWSLGFNFATEVLGTWAELLDGCFGFGVGARDAPRFAKRPIARRVSECAYIISFEVYTWAWRHHTFVN